jgi:hypothetical protein
MKTVRIPVPKIDNDLVGNLIGLLGLILIVLAVGGLTHNAWWGALTAGIFSVVIAYMVQLDDEKPKEG